MSLHRLRTEFEFAVLALFAGAAILGVAPFAVYRFLQGNIVVGLIDSAIVLAIAGALTYAWRGGSLRGANLFVVALTTIGCAAIGLSIGLPGALWSFPVILANFLLVDRRVALTASAVLIAVLVLGGGALQPVSTRLVYLASATVVGLLAYVFAHRSRMQRRQLEALASRDPLTGAYNRRAMDRELHIAAEAYRRHRTPVGVAMLDIDHFKRVNDELGHEAGDAVLVDFVRLVQSRARAGDRLFRHGGEEFVLLLPGTDAESLRQLADELREVIATRLAANGRPITVSIGAAALAPGEQVAQWLARADGSLYEAKHRGRNRVVVAAVPDAAVADGAPAR